MLPPYRLLPHEMTTGGRVRVETTIQRHPQPLNRPRFIPPRFDRCVPTISLCFSRAFPEARGGWNDWDVGPPSTSSLRNLPRDRCLDYCSSVVSRTLLMDETYAETLRNIGRADDALAVRKNIIDTLRQEDPHEHPFSLEIFTNTLIPYASGLLATSQLLEALSVIEEGVSVRRRLAEYQPDLHRRSLGKALSVLRRIAIALTAKLWRPHDKFSISIPKPHASMALRLYSYSIICQRCRRPEDSLRAAEESAKHWSLLYAQDPVFHLGDYSPSLHH